MSEKHETQTPEKISYKAPRILPLDALRGLIMVLIALDHANHFIARQHSPGEYWGNESKYNICRRSHALSVEKDRPKSAPFYVWQIHPLSDDSDDFF